MSKNTIQLGLIGIGETPYRAADFKAQLSECDPSETLFLDIHSEGGSVMEGFEIFNLASEWPGRKVARIRVAAFSIASYIAMACDEIEIANNGFFMIHNPYSETTGDDAAHAKNAKLLGELKVSMINTYSARTGLPAEQIKEMMASESYIGASQAIEIGMADRVIESTKPQRQLPKNHLPTLVLAAMYGKPSVGDPPAETPKENPVSETQKPVAASVSKIKAAFPQASSEFIVKCMEKEMPMEDVGEEYAKAMEDENTELKAKVTAMEEEIVALKAMAPAEEEKEDETPAEAKAHGSAPVALGNASDIAGDPRSEFNALVDSFESKGMTRTRAVLAANKANPQLRQSVVAQANGQLI